jgi:hypothetical protein
MGENAPAGPSPGIILATGSSAFLASLLINLAVGQVANSDRLTTSQTITTTHRASPTTTRTATTTTTTKTSQPGAAPMAGWMEEV